MSKERYFEIHMYGNVLIPTTKDSTDIINRLLDAVMIGNMYTTDPDTKDSIRYIEENTAQVTVVNRDLTTFHSSRSAAEQRLAVIEKEKEQREAQADAKGDANQDAVEDVG